MAEPNAQQQSDLSTQNQPAGTTRIEDGMAYDITGKQLGPANVPADASAGEPQKIDYKALASKMGGTPVVDYKALAAQMGGTPVTAASAQKTAPQQTDDILTNLFSGSKAMPGMNESVPMNSHLAQAKNVSDYIYNNVLGEKSYTHNNLTYDQTPTTAGGKLWQRLWGWATQDEINKIPGLEPDRVAALQAQGNDLLSRTIGGKNAADLRTFLESGLDLPSMGTPGAGAIGRGALDIAANPEVYARTMAKSLTDFFSPGYYALSGFGKVAQGFAKASQLAADAGNMVEAVRAMSKARLLSILSVASNVPFAASQAYDLVEHWDNMNVPERVASVSGILGAVINGHVGIEHLGGYSQVGHDVLADTKATAQEIAGSKAVQATKKAVGQMVTLGRAPTFDVAMLRSLDWTPKKYRAQQAATRAVSPELQRVGIENPNADTPGKFADAIRNWLQQRENTLLQASGGTKDSDVPVSSTLEKDVRSRLDTYFDDHRGEFGNDEQVEAAKEKLLGRLLMTSKAQGAPPSLRMPNAFEAENIRRGLSKEIKPQLNGEPVSNAYKAAVDFALPVLREHIDQFYADHGIENVKEFRTKEKTMIDVADRLEMAEKRANDMGNGSIWSSLVKKYSVPTVITAIALGHNPLAFGALAPYLMSERAYHNYKNPGVNIRRAVELAESFPTTDLRKTGVAPGGPPPVAPTPAGVLPGQPIHPTGAGQAAANVAAATMPEQPTNHVLNSQLATHFGEPVNHTDSEGNPVTLEDRIGRVKSDAEAMRRSGIDISKTQTGKMLGAVNEHEAAQNEAIEKEQQKAHEDAAKVVQELHDEFQKQQEEAAKATEKTKTAMAAAPALTGEGAEAARGKFRLPYETTDEELPESKVAGKGYSGLNTRLHELGHLIWSHMMGLQPFDVLSSSHPDAGDMHALARTDISRLLGPDGNPDTNAMKANLGDIISRFLAGAVAEEVHGGLSLEKNQSARVDVEGVNNLLEALEVPKADQKRIVQEAIRQLRETFNRPEIAEIMKGFASKRKAGLDPNYHFDETQVHQLRAALDNAQKGGPNGEKAGVGINRAVEGEGAGVGKGAVAGEKGGNAPSLGRLGQAQAGLVERTTGSEDHDAAIRNGGGIPAGFMNVPGHGDYKMFHDPSTGSTLTFKPSDTITPQTVGKKLAASRAEFEAGERRAVREAAQKTAPQGGHAGGGVASVEELNRLGRFVKMSRSGVPTDQGKTPDFNLGQGEAGYQVTKEGPKLVSGQETPATKRGVEAYHKEVFGKKALQPAQAAPAEKEDLISKAVEHYGITNSPKKIGYILPDGRGLDFSDGQNVRTLDHGDVAETLPIKHRGENPRERFTRDTGAARFLQSSFGTDVVLPKNGGTAEQAETIARAVSQHPRGSKELSVDLLISPEEFEQKGEQLSSGIAGSARAEVTDAESVQRVINDARRDAARRSSVGALAQAKPSKSVAEGADEYNKSVGRPAIDATVVPHSPEFAKRVADAYDAMKHDPENPEVKKSYNAMAKEVRKQWDYATQKMGMKFEPWTKEGQPYANSKEMVNDVRDNKHLYFFQGGDIKPESPMAKVDKDTGLTYNDMFRAVHDLFGHAAHGFEFGPKGEENAYNVHSQMFPKDAIPALTSETRGQNSWVNFGKHLRNAEGNVPKKGEEGFVPATQRPYAEQKVGLLPAEFHGASSPNVPPEQTTGKHDEAIRAGGGVPGGLEKGDPEANVPDMALFHNPKTGSTMYLPADNVTPENVKAEIEKNNKQFAAEKTPEWAEKVANNMEKAPAGGINPNHPEAESKRYGLEILPEARKQQDEALTAEHFREYAQRPEVKEALAQHPDIKLGWDTTGDKPELNVGASTNDKEKALEVAKKLDQRSLWDNKEEKVVPVGGEGKKTEFPDYPLKDRLRDLGQASPVEKEKAKDLTTPEVKGSSIRLRENPLKVKPSAGFEAPTSVDVAMALSRFTQKQFPALKSGAAEPEEMKARAKSIMEDEAKYQLAQDNSGAAWYTKDIAKHDNILREMRPELKDPAKMSIFKMAEAVLSSGQKPYVNLKQAVKAWDYYNETGEFSPVNPDNKQSWGPRGARGYGLALQSLNNLIAEKGEKGASDWLLSEHPIKELHDQMEPTQTRVSGKADDLQPGVMILGPKRGPFAQNQHGQHSAFTADMWVSRSWHRWMGTAEIAPDGELATDRPRSARERNLMKESFQDTASKLGITTSSLQAALWYYEQALYDAHGVKNIESWSFADAAKRLSDEEASTFDFEEGNKQGGLEALAGKQK